MWNEPSEEELKRLPRLADTENQSLEDIVIRMHFFIGSCDWYVAAYEPDRRIFFGYAILHDDLQNSEWGYVSFDELRRVKIAPGIEVDRDLYWKPKRAMEVEQIRKAHGDFQ